MGYSAYERMRAKNLEKWGLNGPAYPEAIDVSRVWEKDENGRRKDKPVFRPVSDLEKGAIHFIRECCTDLRFKHDAAHEDLEDLDGTSLKERQIPSNFQMDIDRRCLEIAVHRFLESGVAKDAFDVYFCFLEMFIGSYKKTKKMIEMLSEFETNASSLLMKHRDHYSHSVYVFLIGLAFYDKSASFREAYRNAYRGLFAADGLDADNDHDLAAHFLKYWGLSSLFHDTGYPFELSFEQVKSYFGDSIKDVPFARYNMNHYTKPKIGDASGKLKRLLPEECDGEGDVFLKDGAVDLNRFLADVLYRELGEDYAYDRESGKKFQKFEEYAAEQKHPSAYSYRDYLYDVLRMKPKHPEKFDGYIDHAYFSAIILMVTLMDVLDKEDLHPMFSHAFTAILLHNSLYKFSITKYTDDAVNDGRHFALQKHPLAYLLMLCDELQCWDRTSYGQNSRGEVHPFDCELIFEENRIRATYLFDEEAYAENGRIRKEYEDVRGTFKKLDADHGKSKFLKDIENIISINGDDSFGLRNGIELIVDRRFERNRRFRNSYLSESSFIHLYKFAVLVHKMNHLDEYESGQEDVLESEFEKLSLEYKILHVSRTKKFAKILGEIGCFYTDRPMDLEIVRSFGNELDDTMGPIEHERWLWEHWITGWRHAPGEVLEKAAKDCGLEYGIVREMTKLHPDMLEGDQYSGEEGRKHYETLSQETKNKDTEPLVNLLKVLVREDGVKVYRLREAGGQA